MIKLNTFFFLTIVLLGLAFSSCKEDEPLILPKYRSLNINFSHTVDGMQLLLNSPKTYTNSAGNKYMVSTLNYYISNLELTKSDGMKLKFPIYKLIDAFDSSTHTIQLTDIPKGDYKAISYSIGIDSVNNHSGTQTGDLSPTKGMLWTWASGYLFLKLEGFYLNPIDAESFRYHIGTDEFLTKINYVVDFSITDMDKKVSLECNVNEFFVNPNAFDITTNNDVQSFPTQREITKQLADNMKDMIRLLKIE